MNDLKYISRRFGSDLYFINVPYLDPETGKAKRWHRSEADISVAVLVRNGLMRHPQHIALMEKRDAQFVSPGVSKPAHDDEIPGIKVIADKKQTYLILNIGRGCRNGKYRITRDVTPRRRLGDILKFLHRKMEEHTGEKIPVKDWEKSEAWYADRIDAVRKEKGIEATVYGRGFKK